MQWERRHREELKSKDTQSWQLRPPRTGTWTNRVRRRWTQTQRLEWSPRWHRKRIVVSEESTQINVNRRSRLIAISQVETEWTICSNDLRERPQPTKARFTLQPERNQSVEVGWVLKLRHQQRRTSIVSFEDSHLRLNDSSKAIKVETCRQSMNL